MKKYLAAIVAGFLLVVPIAFAEDIVPCNGPDCRLCDLVTLADRIIKWLVGILTIVGAIMLAVAGLRMVTAGGNPGAVSAAKETFTNIVVGFIIMLSAWLIVDTFMKMFVDGNKVGPWNGIKCVEPLGRKADPQPQNPPVGGDPGAPTTTSACRIPALPPITDPLALRMEAMNGKAVIWENTNPKLQQCANKFIGKVGGSVTSAYRPQEYQTHLRSIYDVWCTYQLKTNTDPACRDLKTQVSGEVNTHFGANWSCGSVAAGVSNHSRGIAVDISGINHSSTAVRQAATESCLIWRNYQGDPFHYDLNLNASCVCN